MVAVDFETVPAIIAYDLRAFDAPVGIAREPPDDATL